ncbi:MAG: aminopeptidase [Rhizobiaceae bacterium]
MTIGRWVMVIAVCCLPALGGCTAVSYYAQSISGHLNIVAAGRPIDGLVDDPRQPKPLRDRLSLARDIRAFATEELALPDNASYRNYVDTGRDFVSWAVFAAPELSLEPHTWCFPVMGCVPYRGYFSKEAAEKFAEDVRAEGFDVHVGGIPAYSTLGMFADPLLNTMLRHGETYLAEVIFHELTHQRVYVAGDSRFNESFAMAVERTGTVAWLESRGNGADLREYRASRRRSKDFVALVARTQKELGAIYAGHGGDAEKRAAKEAAIARLRTRYRRLRDGRWNGFAGYDQWFDGPINNAKLATIAVYNDNVPAFTRLLDICRGDYERFYRAVERIGALDPQRRMAALNAARHCE